MDPYLVRTLGYESVSQDYGFAEPDPNFFFSDPQNWKKLETEKIIEGTTNCDNFRQEGHAIAADLDLH